MSRTSRQAVQGVLPRQNLKPTNHPLHSRLVAALEQDERLVVLASSLATHSLPTPHNRLAELAEAVALRFPARFYGLGEFLADLVPTATRLALEGKHPLVLMGSADLARSYAGFAALCTQRLGVIFLLASGPAPGQTWRSSLANDVAILRTLPQLYVGAPSNLDDLSHQLLEARQVEDNPVAIYYAYPETANRSSGPLLPTPINRPAGIGKSVVLREGKHLALLSFGSTIHTTTALAAHLEEAGYQAAVVDVRWVRPLDEALLTAVAHHFPRLVTLEAGHLEGGFGSAVLELLERRGLYATRLKRLALVRKPSLPKLTETVVSFLDTLQRDEGLPAPLSRYLARSSG